jgi:hypothetical protein
LFSDWFDILYWKASVCYSENPGFLNKTIIESFSTTLGQTCLKLKYFFHFGNFIFEIQNHQRQHNFGVSSFKFRLICHYWNLNSNCLEFLKIKCFFLWFWGNWILLCGCSHSPRACWRWTLSCYIASAVSSFYNI